MSGNCESRKEVMQGFADFSRIHIFKQCQAELMLMAAIWNNCERCDYKNQLEAIMECSFDGIYICDGNGVFIKVNEGVERITGIRRSKLIGMYAPELVKRGMINRSVTEIVLKTKKRTTIVQSIKSDADGTVKDCIVTSTPLLGDDGHIKYVIANLRDVTELVQLRDNYARSERLLAEYNRELTLLRACSRDIVASSQAMQKLLSQAARVGSTDAAVLIEGESGTGKELIARFIHSASPRKDGPFLAINCGALPESLIEAELFGYERGAFTGAKPEGSAGLFEAAAGGTVFLDEIDSLSLQAQGKLLRTLDSKEGIRVGSCKVRTYDCRFVAATNKDLMEMCKSGRFRQDLYYRLNVVTIKVPPLRHRREDIEPLCMHFLEMFNEKYGFKKTFAPDTLNAMVCYNWPGNVRELKNLIERLVITSESQVISPTDLPVEIRNANLKGSESEGLRITIERIPRLSVALKMTEREVFRKALSEYSTTREIAQVLGISQSTVVRRLQRMKLSGMLMQ